MKCSLMRYRNTMVMMIKNRNQKQWTLYRLEEVFFIDVFLCELFNCNVKYTGLSMWSYNDAYVTLYDKIKPTFYCNVQCLRHVILNNLPFM